MKALQGLQYPINGASVDWYQPTAAVGSSAENNTTAPHLLPKPDPKFVLTAIDNVVVEAAPAWAIEGLLPARGLAVILGAPKVGKSFLVSDALFAVARGASYAGRGTLQGPVVYCTGEGVNGFKARLVAMRRRYEAEGNNVPFHHVDKVPDLGSEHTDVLELIADIRSQLGGKRPRAVALDTLACCMANGDENSARDARYHWQAKCERDWNIYSLTYWKGEGCRR